jgi:hypothetical protein
MEEACVALEIEFKRIINDLNFVSHKIESEYKGNGGKLRCVHPIQLSHRLIALESKLQKVLVKAEGLSIEKNRVLVNLNNALLAYPEVQTKKSAGEVREAEEEATANRRLLTSTLQSIAY